MFLLRHKEKQSSLRAPRPESPDYTFIHLPNGTCFPQRLSARQSFRLIKFIFWLLFLSLISQSDTLHWKLKGEEIGEVHWFTVLLYFWLETKMSCGLTCKITHLSPLNVSDLNLRIINPNSVRLCDCSYRAFRGRWEAIARRGILSRCNQATVFLNLLAVDLNSEGKKEGLKKKGRVGEKRKEGRGIAISSASSINQADIKYCMYIWYIYLYIQLIVHVVPKSYILTDPFYKWWV